MSCHPSLTGSRIEMFVARAVACLGVYLVSAAELLCDLGP